MKNLFVTSLLFLNLIAFSFSQSNSNSKPFILKGKILGEDSGRIVLQYYAEKNKWIRDTVSIKDGEFIFKGNIIHPIKAKIGGSDVLNTATIYLEPSDMTIILTKDKFAELKMTGSKTDQEAKELDRLEEPINNRNKLLYTQNMSILDSIEKTKDKAILDKLNRKYNEIDQLRTQLRKPINDIAINFVVTHPKSFLTPYVLLDIEKNEFISLDSLKSVFNKLDITIQNSIYGQEIKKDITKKINSSVGATAPDFKAIDILTMQPVTYSQFKGENVVLIDFWASWCVHCREGFPHLKSLYKKYHSKGFEIVAVSLDRTKIAWLSAIKQDSSEIWHHIPVAERYADGPSYLTKDDIYENYFVQAIPLQLLIDKDGKIIGRWVGNSKEKEKELDKKIANLFKKN
ncbi:MAG TPA: hypothetical protein DCR40_01240 [Prolixibacteraceae bacterium]|nr:hypothetical protein [Prolixibacteraceae bacterium]